MKKSNKKKSDWLVRIKLSSDTILTSTKYDSDLEFFIDSLTEEHVKSVKYYYDKDDPNDVKEVYDDCKANIISDCKVAVTKHTKKFNEYTDKDHIVINEGGSMDGMDDLYYWVKVAILLRDVLNREEV